MRISHVAIFIAVPTVALAGEAPDWVSHLRGLSPWERLTQIKAVSELPKAVQRQRLPALIRLLNDDDQSVRITAAAEIADIRDVAPDALPHLIENFTYEHGEEGLAYVEAVAAFGEQALPQLQRALESANWLVRARACDAVRMIKPRLYLDGECKQKAP